MTDCYTDGTFHIHPLPLTQTSPGVQITDQEPEELSSDNSSLDGDELDLTCSTNESVVTFLHTTWDLGITTSLDALNQPFIRHIAKGSQVAQLNVLQEGDILTEINGQSLQNLDQVAVSALLRALPRGLVRLKVNKGLPNKLNATLSPSPTPTTTQQDHFSSSPSQSEPEPKQQKPKWIRMDSYYQQMMNYGSSSLVSSSSSSACEHSIRIEPDTRTHFSHTKTVRIGQPAEFVVRIQREQEEDVNDAFQRTRFGSQQHTWSGWQSESNRQIPVTLELIPEQKMNNRHYSSSISIQEKRKYFSNNNNNPAMENTARERNIPIRRMSDDQRPSVRGNTNSPPVVPAEATSVAVGNDHKVSDNFRKNRDKFLNNAESPADNKSHHSTNNGAIESASWIKKERPVATIPAQNVSAKPALTTAKYQRHRSFSNTSSNSSSSHNQPLSIPAPPEIKAQPTRQTKEARVEDRSSDYNQPVHTVHSKTGNGGGFKALDRYKSKTDMNEDAASAGPPPTYQRRHSTTPSNNVASKTGLFESKAAEAQDSTGYLRSRRSSNASSIYNSIGDFGANEFGRRSTTPQPSKSLMPQLSLQPEERILERSRRVAKMTAAVQEPVKMAPLKTEEPKGTNAASVRNISAKFSSGHGENVVEAPVRHKAMATKQVQPIPVPEVAPSWKTQEIRKFDRNGLVDDIKLEKIAIIQPELPKTQPLMLAETTAQEHLKEKKFVTDDELISFDSRASSQLAASPIPSSNIDLLSEPLVQSKEGKVIKKDFPTNEAKPTEAKSEVTAAEDMNKWVSREESQSSRRSRTASLKSESAELISEEEEKELLAMGKRLLGGETANQRLILVAIKRPEGITSGGIGVVLTGGADYENNQIKINKVITHSLAHKDGRVQEGDRLLLINGQTCTNMTHRQALDVLKAKADIVTLVVSRDA